MYPIFIRTLSYSGNSLFKTFPVLLLLLFFCAKMCSLSKSSNLKTLVCVLFRAMLQKMQFIISLDVNESKTDSLKFLFF